MNAFTPSLGRLGHAKFGEGSGASKRAGEAQPSLFDRFTETPAKPRAKPLPRTNEPSGLVGESALHRSRASTPRPLGRVHLFHLRYRLLLSARTRAFGLILAFAALTMIALTRIVWLGIDGEGAGVRREATTLVPGRGEITDRNGAVLARDYPQAYALWFNPEAMQDDGSALTRPVSEVAERLKAIIPELDEDRVRAIMASEKRTYLTRRILPEQANLVN
ncbi:MAG: hypothetical protein AAF692_09830 [Pseudomonadota bacterium]